MCRSDRACSVQRQLCIWRGEHPGRLPAGRASSGYASTCSTAGRSLIQRGSPSAPSPESRAAIVSGFEPHFPYPSVAPLVSTKQSDVFARDTDPLQKHAGPGITPCQVKQQQEIGSGLMCNIPTISVRMQNFHGVQNVTSTMSAEFQDG